MGDAKTFINARIAINKVYERLGMKRRIDNGLDGSARKV